MNAMKTTLLLGLLSGVLIIGGGAIAGERGLTYGLVMAVAMNFFSYFFSEKMVLMSARAQRVSPTEYPEIYARLEPIVGTLAQRMAIPMPQTLGHAGPIAQRFRHRAEPDTRLGGRNIGNPATDEGRRTGRGAGPRTEIF